MFKNIKKILGDLLTVQDPEKQGEWHYSQSRVYLLICLVLIICMSVMSYFLEFDNKNFQFALDTLFWLSVFFGSYALVGKGLKYRHLEKLISYKSKLPDKIKDVAEDQIDTDNKKTDPPVGDQLPSDLS